MRLQKYFSIVALFLFTLAACKKDDKTSIEYPASGQFGINILDKEKTVYTDGLHSMRAVLGDEAKIRVVITGTPYWLELDGISRTWEVSDYNSITKSREFKSNKTGTLDTPIELVSGTNLDIVVYEHDAEEPSWEKTITVQ